MMDFEAWFNRTQQDRKYFGMLYDAFRAGAAQAMNYVADDEVHPREITFAGGATVIVKLTFGRPAIEIRRDYPPQFTPKEAKP